MKIWACGLGFNIINIRVFPQKLVSMLLFIVHTFKEFRNLLEPCVLHSVNWNVTFASISRARHSSSNSYKLYFTRVIATGINVSPEVDLAWAAALVMRGKETRNLLFVVSARFQQVSKLTASAEIIYLGKFFSLFHKSLIFARINGFELIFLYLITVKRKNM